MFSSDEALATYLADPALMLDDVRSFEKKVHAREGGRWAVGVNSATSGLLAALLSLGVRSGDEVVVPVLSWGQTWTAPLLLGCRLVAVDLAEEWPVIDPEKVAGAISSRTRAVISVGLWGSPAGLVEVDAICRRHRVPHVVDAAQLIGTRIGGQKIGETGDLVVLSFGPSKSFSCGEGGIVLVRKDAVLRDRLLWLTQHPYRVHSEADDELLVETARDGVGLNLRLHPLAARAGLRFFKNCKGTKRKLVVPRRIVEEEAARYGLQKLYCPARFETVRVQSNKAFFDARGVERKDRETFRNKVSDIATAQPCMYKPLSTLSLCRRESFLPWTPRRVRPAVNPKVETLQASRWASDMEIVTLQALPPITLSSAEEFKHEKGERADVERNI